MNYDHEIEKRAHPENFDRIDELDIEWEEEEGFEKINGMRHPDSRIEELAEKVNEIIEYLNEDLSKTVKTKFIKIK